MKMHFGKSVAVRGPERAGGGATVDTAHMAKGATTSKGGVPLTNMAEASRMAAENAGEADADANEKVKTNAVKESALPASGQISEEKEAMTNAVEKSAVGTAHMAKGELTSKNGVAKTHHTEPRGKQLQTNMAAALGKAAVDDREANEDANKEVKTNAAKESALPASEQIAKDKEAMKQPNPANAKVTAGGATKVRHGG